MLDINASMFGIVVLLGILVLVLNRLFYKPVGQVLHDREKKIKDETASIEARTREIEELTLSIENSLKSAQRESRKIKEELIKKGESIKEHLLNEEREKAKKMFDEKMAHLDNQIQAAEKLLIEQIGQFSDKIKEIFI